MHPVFICFIVLISCLDVSYPLDFISEKNSLNENIFGYETNHSFQRSNPALNIVPENCTLALDAFIDKIAKLTRCTLYNARPIRVCMKCEKEIKNTQKSYKKLKDEPFECQQFYFQSDQIGIIDLVYTQVQSVWVKNNCQNCYDHSNDTDKFFNISQQFDACVQEANKTSGSPTNNTCEMCHDLFAELNDLYNKFVLGIGTYDIGGVCMDIVDKMNITRLYWATQNCIVFDFNIGYPNVITAVLVGAMPVFFYMLSKNISIIEDVKLVRPKRKSFITVVPSN